MKQKRSLKEEENEEEEEGEESVPSKRHKTEDMIEEAGVPQGVPLHSLFEGEEGYLCVLPRLDPFEVKLRVTQQALHLAVSYQPPSGKDLHKVANTAAQIVDLETVAPEFEQEWVAQGCHKQQLTTYTIPLLHTVETTTSLIKREDGDKYVVFFIPYQHSDDVWV